MFVFTVSQNRSHRSVRRSTLYSSVDVNPDLFSCRQGHCLATCSVIGARTRPGSRGVAKPIRHSFYRSRVTERPCLRRGITYDRNVWLTIDDPSWLLERMYSARITPASAQLRRLLTRSSENGASKEGIVPLSLPRDSARQHIEYRSSRCGQSWLPMFGCRHSECRDRSAFRVSMATWRFRCA